MTHDEASSVAAEHIRWAQEQRLTPRALIKLVGGKCPVSPTWDDAFWAIGMAWMNIRRSERDEEAA